MNIKRRQEHVSRLLEDVGKALGYARTAAVLAAHANDKLLTDQEVINLVKERAHDIKNITAYPARLYFLWMIESLEEARHILENLDFRKMEAFRRARRSDWEIWGALLKNAKNCITKSTSGVYACVDSIFSEHKDLNHRVLALVAGVKEMSVRVDRNIDLVFRPIYSFSFRRRQLFSLLLHLWGLVCFGTRSIRWVRLAMP